MADEKKAPEVKAKKTKVEYTQEQKDALLKKWDGTTKGAKELKVSYTTIKGWRDGKAPKAAKPAASGTTNLLAEIKATKKLKKYADADKDVPASLRNAISAHFDKLIDSL